MAVAPEIKTKFTMAGLAEVASKLRAFSRNVKTQFASIGKDTAKVFKPPLKGLIALEKKAKEVGQATLKVGARGAFAGVKIGAIGAGLAVGALALKITAVGAAAVKVSKDTAMRLNEISRDAKKIGASTQDVSVLGFAGERNGVDRDELINQINQISAEFLNAQDAIAKARKEYSGFLSDAREDNAIARMFGNKDALREQKSSFPAAQLEALKGSYADSQERIAQIDGYLDQIVASGGNDRAREVATAMLRREREQLAKSSEESLASLSPQGQAYFDLQNYGLDNEGFARGGIDMIESISDAFQKIPDKSERARIAIKLFGEDAGSKMMPLLMGGRKAMDEYRKELERFGAIVTPEYAALAEANTKSADNLKMAFAGVQMEISRNLMPHLTAANESLTEWLIRSRVAIAENVTNAFLALRTFGEDVISIFNGDTDNLKTGWLDVTVRKILEAKVIFDKVWKDITKQFALLSNGRDSDYQWINVIRDGLVVAKMLALDLLEIFTGGNATEFKWLNGLRDDVLWFRDRLVEAFEMFKTVLTAIHEAVRPIFEYFNTDVTTGLLFIGLLRISGVIGLVTTAFGILKGAIGGVVGMGAGLLGLTGTLIKFIAATGRVVAAGARGGLAGAFSAATAVEVGAVTAAVGGLTAATTNLAGKTPAVGIAAKAAAAAQADWYRSATPATASLTTRIGEMIAKIPLIGTAFQAVGSKFGGVFGGMTKGFLGLGVTIGGVISGAATLITTALAAFEAGGAVAAYMHSGVRGAQDEYNKAQAGLIAANDEVYQRRLARSTDDKLLDRRNNARRLLGQKGHEQSADEKYLKVKTDWDWQVLGRVRHKGPDAIEEYRAEDARMKMPAPVAAPAVAPQPSAVIRYELNVGGVKAQLDGDMTLKRGFDKLARGW